MKGKKAEDTANKHRIHLSYLRVSGKVRYSERLVTLYPVLRSGKLVSFYIGVCFTLNSSHHGHAPLYSHRGVKQH